MRIGIFGGTFNPPHMGHVSAARACVDALGLDRLWLVPAGTPPHKRLPRPALGERFGSVSAAERLEMAHLAAGMIPGGAACDIELRRPGPSYTVDSLRELTAACPGDSLWLIVGTDMLLSFERWREYREIARMVRLAAVARREGDSDRLREKAAWLAADCGARVDIIDNRPVEVSSTGLRRRGPEEAADEIPGPVAEYLRGLWGLTPEVDALRETVRARMDARRYAHTLGTERAAAWLARCHGADVCRARLAALLHDITKDLSLPQQLQLCEEWGIMLDYPPERFPSILHADTGALVAKHEFAMDDAICDAIRFHTTGRPGMGALDKILYVADKIEETRDFHDVPPIRDMACEDLDGAVILVLRGCLDALARQGREADGRTLATLEYMSRQHPEKGV